MSGPRIGSLCSGYGGLEMGVQAAIGGTTAWVSDIDKGACKILAHRFPDVPNIGDMTAVDWSQVEPVDVLTGGTPCQDLSHAGKRAGMTEGTRSNLWVAMREAIAQLRPGLVIWENVRGAYSAEADSDLVNDPRLLAGTRRRDGEPVLRALGRVLGDLSELGYVGGWHGLRAADVGAPHGRFRVFVVAYPGGEELSRRAGLRPGGPTGIGRGRPRYDTHADGDGSAPLSLLGTPRASEWKGSGPVGSKSHAHMLDREYLSAQVLSLLPTPTTMDAASSGGGYNGQSNVTLTDAAARQGSAHVPEWGQYADAIARWEALTRPAPPPTETGANGGPRLSAAFSEWLMGLPAGWVTDVPGITRNEALKALGNGVVPQQAEAAVRFLLTAALRGAVA